MDEMTHEEIAMATYLLREIRPLLTFYFGTTNATELAVIWRRQAGTMEPTNDMGSDDMMTEGK